MHWGSLLACFFGGLFLANAVPHFVSGTMGRAFQSPFAKPPGKGLSSSTINVAWGFVNAVIAYLLLVRVSSAHLRDTRSVCACGLGVLVMSLMHARSFGRFHGGNLRERP